MASYFKQNTDGTMVITKASNDEPVMRLGGATVATATAPTYLGRQMAKVALTASDAAAGLFSWQNPELGPILVTRLVLDITTPSSGACTADCGVAATAILNDTLMDGVSLATAAKVVDNINDAGTNGKARQRVVTSGFVTGSVASGASAGLVGAALIEYVIL